MSNVKCKVNKAGDSVKTLGDDLAYPPDQKFLDELEHTMLRLNGLLEKITEKLHPYEFPNPKTEKELTRELPAQYVYFERAYSHVSRINSIISLIHDFIDSTEL